jgi:hypothetical protein
MVKLAMIKHNAWDKSAVLSVKKEVNDNGTYFVWQVTPGKLTTDEQRALAATWHTNIGKMTPKVDNSDLQADAPAAPASDIPF